MTTTLFIEPSDVLLFRDGRSFSAGDQLATGHFPPHPTTVYGALRSALLSQGQADFRQNDFGLNGKELGTVVGTKTQLGRLTLTGFSLARRTAGGVEALYPIPYDVLIQKDDRGQPFAGVRATYLVPSRALAGAPSLADRSNMPAGLAPLWPAASGTDDKVTYTGAAGWLPGPAFARLLRGDIKALQEAVRPEALFVSEPRTSVALTPGKRTAAEGLLYSVQFTRPRDGVGFLVEATAPTLPLAPAGWLRLGGEARAAHYETAEATAHLPAYEMGASAPAELIKLTVVTPAPFAAGWIPDGIDPETLRGTVADVPCTLVGAAVASPQHLGGWDVAAGRPKPTRRAVPAGSTYFLQVDDSTKAQELAVRRAPLSLLHDEALQQQGLGLSYFGISSPQS